MLLDVRSIDSDAMCRESRRRERDER